MKSEYLYKGPSHECIVFGRDPNKTEKIIDTNQYMLLGKDGAVLIDPGGIEVFSSMLTAIVHHVPISKVQNIFSSHQDPDVISSLGYWDKTLENATLYAPEIWEGFLRHYGCNNIKFESISDEGGEITICGIQLQVIPAHYLHSAGNFSLYDPQSKILFSGDIGAGLSKINTPFLIEDFNENINNIKYFHQRWMSSAKAKENWIKRIRRLDVELMCPQHGAIYKREDVSKFLDWFDDLEVGIASRQ